MIVINIIWIFIVGLICLNIGFFIAAFLSGKKFSELDSKIKKLKMGNNRKDTIIKFYQANNIKTNIDGRKSK